MRIKVNSQKTKLEMIEITQKGYQSPILFYYCNKCDYTSSTTYCKKSLLTWMATHYCDY